MAEEIVEPEAVTTEPEAEAGTILEGGDKSPPSDVDWRVTLGGDDKDAQKTLGRYKSAGDFMKAFSDGQTLIRSGAHKAAPELGDAPTEEELATFRTETGIPLEAKGYLDALPDGLVLGEADEEAYGSYAEFMHGKNASPESVHNSLAWFQQFQEDQVTAQAAADKEAQTGSVEEMRAEWGTDFKPNLDSALNFLNATAPTMEDGTPVADLILGGRTADGKLLGDHPGFLRWLAGVAHEQNPAGFVAPGSGLSQADSVDSEIGEIEKYMRTNRNDYNADEAKQSRLRELYEARAKIGQAA